MAEIVVSTQAELDALPASFTEYTRIVIKNTSTRLTIHRAWENSSVEAWDNSSVVARNNSSVVAWNNSSVEAWENSSVKAWENSSVVARNNSSVVAWGNSSVEAWGNSSVVAWGNVVVRIFSAYLKKVALFGFAVAFLPVAIEIDIEKNSVHAHIQIVKPLSWFANNALKKTKIVTLFKRVSADFKTQENTRNETLWAVGSTITHPKWSPANAERGEGKFHACSRPYFCDEFRKTKGDKYIAVSIKLADLHEWNDNPVYPHKIAFREGKVLYECDRFGNEIKR
jgi:hypothetical protein